MDNSSVPRLIFLADQLRPRIPEILARYLPNGKVITAIAKHGIAPTAIDLSIPKGTLMKMYQEGGKAGEGSEDEFRYLVGVEVMDAIELNRDEMSLTEYMEQIASVRDYVVYGSDQLVDTAEFSFAEEPLVGDIPKWDSGFTAFDLVVGGFYQGIFTLQAKPGHGKTSFMLAMGEAMVKSKIASEIWFYEVEIPTRMMNFRTAPMRKRTKFRDGDRLITGAFTTRQILLDLKDYPDPDRVIFLDGPDAMTASAGEGRRFALDAIYRDLIRIKELSKAVIVSSQPRRKDGQLGMESVAESWGKAWYSDVILGIHKLGTAPGGFTNIMLNCSKNRFGLSGQQIQFRFNYGNLDWSVDRDVTTDWDAEVAGGW